MAQRNDLIINWESSPRIIEVAAPSTELTMQDFLDTLRFMEATPEAMDNKSIVRASGKEVLDSNTKVGLSVTLLNARISFEARNGTEYGGVDEWTVCDLLGGNLVAVDEDGVTPIQSIHPTAFVSISKTSSSSATLQEQDALQYSSYQNAVWVDSSSNQVGTDFPSGTREFPVNNVQDAVVIGNDKGFSDLHFIGNYTLSAGDDVTNFTLVGQNPMRTFLIMGADATIANVEIRECTVAGTLDGNATVRECVIWDIDYFSGYIHNSVLTNSVIRLGNNAVALFLHCYSGVPGAGTPTIDMGGSGQSLGLRNYNGGIKLINRDGTDGVSLDMNAGHVIIGEDFQGDPAYIRGVYNLTIEGSGVVPYTEGRALVEQNSPTIGGVTAQEVWEYTTRTLTSGSGGDCDLTEVTNKLNELLDYNEGSWKIIANQMIYYKRDGSEFMRFDLLDSAGQPISRGAMQRVKV